MKTNLLEKGKLLTKERAPKQSGVQEMPDMDYQEKRSHYTTTDEFFFDRENDIIQVNFGPTRVQLSSYAAHDLVYRLASYLIFLEHGEGKRPMHDDTATDVAMPDNLLMYPGSKKNEQ